VSLPRELQELEAKYDQLVQGAEEGHFTAQQALAALANLTATDAAGAIWSLNAEGDFVRAAAPGAPAVVTDPSQFATTAPASPVLGSQPSQVPGVEQPAAGTAAANPGGYPTGPAAFPTGPSVFGAGPDTSLPQAGNRGALVPNGTPAPGPAPAAPAVDPFATPPAALGSAGQPLPGQPSAATPLPGTEPVQGAPTLTRKQIRAEKRAARSLTAAERGGPTVGQRVAAWVSANRALAALILIAALVGAGLWWNGQQAGGGSPLPPVNTTQDVPDMPTTGAEEDRTGEEDRTVEEEPVADPVPSKAATAKVIEALSSGRKDVVARQFATSPDPVELSLTTARWAGAAQVLTVEAGPAAPSGAGAVQEWTVKDGATVVATIQVTWVQVEDTWKLAATPTY
jgi:hypothetical protein